jgi:hypothetical protein
MPFPPDAGRRTGVGYTQGLQLGEAFGFHLVLFQSSSLCIFRLATDLNLHQVSMTQPQTESQEREVLNRTRVWMICFNLDRSTATQFGKPSTIKEDYITRNSADWYRQSQYRDKVGMVSRSGTITKDLIGVSMIFTSAPTLNYCASLVVSMKRYSLILILRRD